MALQCQLFLANTKILFLSYTHLRVTLQQGLKLTSYYTLQLRQPSERHILIGMCMTSPLRRSFCYLSKSLKASSGQIVMSSDISQWFYSIIRNGAFLKPRFYLILAVSIVRFFTEIFNPLSNSPNCTQTTKQLYHPGTNQLPLFSWQLNNFRKL